MERCVSYLVGAQWADSLQIAGKYESQNACFLSSAFLTYDNSMTPSFSFLPCFIFSKITIMIIKKAGGHQRHLGMLLSHEENNVCLKY